MAELYHYTTGAGLLGMLKDYDAEKNPNLTMWATHYAYMNDPTEFEFGKDICLPLIKEIEEEEHVSESNRVSPILENHDFKQFNDIFRRVEAMYPQLIGLVNPYIISLSLSKDSLHMWNMYGQNGNGLALCMDSDIFNKKHLMAACLYIDKDSKEQRINYIKQRLKILYKRTSRNLTDNLRATFTDIYSPQYKVTRAFLLTTYILRGVASYIKNNAYLDEQEYRILARNSKRLLFREKNGEIIPYIEYKLQFDSLSYIIVGPTRDFERTRNSILLLLGQKGIFWSPDKIIKSNVPYRG